MIKTKYLLFGIILLACLIIPTKAAIAPQPRVELDQYEMTESSTDNVYVEGTVSLARGQWITLHASTSSLPVNYVVTTNSNKSEDFKIKVPSQCLKEGTNTFYVMSKSLKNKVSASNFKTVTIKVSKASKKSQSITASDILLGVGDEKDINAKATSGLPLEYKVKDASIVTVFNGKLTARKVGTTTLTISQEGNQAYSSCSKTISIEVADSSSVNRRNRASQLITVTFKANGGKGSMSKQSMNPKLTTRIKANKFKRKGYTFIGWNTNRSNSPRWSNRQKVSGWVTGTLYACWKYNGDLTVKFKANGGTGSMTKITRTKKVSFKLPKNRFTRTGYKFKGWTNVKGSNKVKWTNKKKVNWSKSKTLYAVWKHNGYYTVKFRANGGTGSMKSIKRTKGVSYKLPANKFKRTGYTFKGWTNIKGSNKVKWKNKKKVTWKKSGTLYACWEINKTDTVNIKYIDLKMAVNEAIASKKGVKNTKYFIVYNRNSKTTNVYKQTSIKNSSIIDWKKIKTMKSTGPSKAQDMYQVFRLKPEGKIRYQNNYYTYKHKSDSGRWIYAKFFEYYITKYSGNSIHSILYATPYTTSGNKPEKAKAVNLFSTYKLYNGTEQTASAPYKYNKSGGCVRVSKDNAKYIYNLANNHKVLFYLRY